MSAQTESELKFEEWCRQRKLPFRQIKPAPTDGYQRPDYAVQVSGGWCIVEIKQIDPNDSDDALLNELVEGKPAIRWVGPGKRLGGKLRDAGAQLSAFSKRGFPTVACVFDNTTSFHAIDLHVLTAMFGREVLTFDASGSKSIKESFLGTRRKGAAVTAVSNTSISALAVLVQGIGPELAMDLCHNPHARVPIPRDRAAPFVRKQLPEAQLDREKSVIEKLQSGELRDWIDDPERKLERAVAEALAEVRAKRGKAG